jgi:MFS family permease
VADRIGAGRVLIAGLLLVALGTALTPFMTSTLGGKSFEWTGSYDWMWWADIVLAVGAALAHLPIDEKRLALAVQRPERRSGEPPLQKVSPC